MDEPNYETLELKPEQVDRLILEMNRIFNYKPSKSKNDIKPDDVLKSLVNRRYHRIMPEDLPKPLFGRRIRVYRSGFNHKERLGGKWDDHIIGLVRTYKDSRPHYLGEVYFGNTNKPHRYLYNFVPHQSMLFVSAETSPQLQMQVEPINDSDIEFDDVDILLEWINEVYSSKNGLNNYIPGMRHGRLRFILPQLA